MILSNFTVVLMLLFVFNEGESLETDRSSQSPGKPELHKNSRRILQGGNAGDTRPYMVYLRPTRDAQVSVKNWLCGGVIIHEHYILTSAACIEDAKQFYVVSGTHKWVDADTIDNECIQNGALRAIWKCVPKSYIYDGKEFDNINWMNDDIAIVRVEDDFNFKKRVRGCDFIPMKIGYNNISQEFEKPGTIASIAGWGSVSKFSDAVGLRREKPENSPNLLETDTQIISKKNCKKRWPERYHEIIDTHMICTRSSLHGTGCDDDDLKCQQLIQSEYDDGAEARRMDQETEVHNAAHKVNGTRRSKTSGGFCENDHGGPLITGFGTSTVVTGIISACQTRADNRRCYGPFLYTSVWNHRRMIDCAIAKDIGSRRVNSEECRKLLRSSKTKIKETFFDWKKKKSSG